MTARTSARCLRRMAVSPLLASVLGRRICAPLGPVINKQGSLGPHGSSSVAAKPPPACAAVDLRQGAYRALGTALPNLRPCPCTAQRPYRQFGGGMPNGRPKPVPNRSFSGKVSRHFFFDSSHIAPFRVPMSQYSPHPYRRTLRCPCELLTGRPAGRAMNTSDNIGSDEGVRGGSRVDCIRASMYCSSGLRHGSHWRYGALPPSA